MVHSLLTETVDIEWFKAFETFYELADRGVEEVLANFRCPWACGMRFWPNPRDCAFATARLRGNYSYRINHLAGAV